MKYFAFLALLGGVGILGGCSGGAAPTPPVASSAVSRQLSVTLAHRLQIPVHTDPGPSWMHETKKNSTLIYAADWSNNDVLVFDYPKGKLVGTLTGFDEPYGGCVDAKGDVFMTNYGNAEALEYAHGGTKILNTYKLPGGSEPMGCSVDKSGDLAVTSFSPGEVVVFAGGKPKKSKIYNDSDCNYQWSMGYDDKGNLVGVGESSAINVCALLAGAKKETTLRTSGVTIYYPGGTSWDGKYIGLGDEEANGGPNTGVHETNLSGTMLKEHNEAVLTQSSWGEMYDVNPFVLGKKNTPVNDRQGKVVVGVNADCATGIFYWHYPQGGDPYFGFTNYEVGDGVIAVSIGT